MLTRQCPAHIAAAVVFLGCSHTLGQEQAAGVTLNALTPVQGPVWFNVDFVRAKWESSGVHAVSPRACRECPRVDFDDPASVVQFVLTHLEPEERVFPSEQYFYYRFPLGTRVVSGNIRFVDVQKGILHVGYFDEADRESVRLAEIVDGRDGTVRVSEDGATVDVVYRGLQRRFILDRSWAQSAEAVPLLESERLVSGVLDESGFYLWLLFDERLKQFFYVLNEAQPLPDRLAVARPEAPRLEVGVESRFVFYTDAPTNRRILVAVSSDAIARNSYYDGPFDQVPPNLPIKAMLEAAYPYVSMRGGIDEHGNFVGLQHQRVAISPYQSYERLDQIVAFLTDAYAGDARDAKRWGSMTYETKSRFHEQLQAQERREKTESIEAGLGNLTVRSHDRAVSKLWPANHWRHVSAKWPNEEPGRISSWPANHALEASNAAPRNAQGDVHDPSTSSR
jgi:hypothetical protein